MIEYSAQVNNMCPITKGPKHGPAPIPEEGQWVKAYKIEDISGYTHGVGWCAPQQGTCKLSLNIKNGIIEEALVETIGCSGMTHSAAMAGEILPGKTILEANEAFIRFLFPVPAFKSAFVKLGSRKKVTISRIGVALGLDMDGDYVREMKMFAGAVAIKPVAFEKACDFMKGKTINEQNVLDVAGFLSDYIAENVAPEFDRDYKVYASRGVVTDVFDRILGRL